MNTRTLLNLGLPALLIAGATVAGASARDVADARAAAAMAGKAEKSLTKRDIGAAIAWAERAVELSPHDAAYRALLGQSYLRAGRFESARATLEEAVRLDARDGPTALNLVLVEIATGDWARARRTLDEHADKIGASDRGLALALAGDPAAAVALLTQAAREPGAGTRTRQNLALSLGLAGQWQAAKIVAETDMSPADVDRRMLEWIAFAQPRAASDQVASLLGVRAVQDPGRPVRLALNAPAPEQGPVAAASVEVAQLAAEPEAASSGKLVFAPAKEVVQALPAATIRAKAAPPKLAQTRRPQPMRVMVQRPAAAPATGQWHVQIGAYDSAGVAQDAWGRATRRFAAFRGLTPLGTRMATDKGRFYHLSVGGFARADAVSLCERYRAKGGACFLRVGAGDQPAAWVRRNGVQFAMR